MNFEDIERVMNERRLSVWERMVLVVLMYHANSSGECWPSQGLIAQEANMSERQVSRVIGGLERDRFVRKVGKRGTNLVYRLTVRPGDNGRSIQTDSHNNIDSQSDIYRLPVQSITTDSRVNIDCESNKVLHEVKHEEEHEEKAGDLDVDLIFDATGFYYEFNSIFLKQRGVKPIRPGPKVEWKVRELYENIGGVKFFRGLRDYLQEGEGWDWFKMMDHVEKMALKGRGEGFEMLNGPVIYE